MTRKKGRSVNALVQALQRLAVQPQPQQGKRKKRNRRRGKGYDGGIIVPTGQPGMPPRPNPRNGLGLISGTEASMRVRRAEVMFMITTAPGGTYGGAIPLNPIQSKDQFSWLAGLATSWERIVWNRLAFSWRSAVGTTTDGLVAYGVDWEANTTVPTNRGQVAALYPVADHPVWQSTQNVPLVLPVAMLQSRRHYLLNEGDLADRCPGTLKIGVQGAPGAKVVGEIWVEYDVVMLGPKKA